MITRSNLKVAIAQLYARNAFAPSSIYYDGLQSPFTDGAGPTSTWALAYNAIHSQVWQLTGQGLVMFQIEWLAVLVDDFNIDPKTITFFSDNPKKTTIAQGIGVQVIEDLNQLRSMRFGYALANAPFDQGIDTITKVTQIPFYNIGANSVIQVLIDEILDEGGICFNVWNTNWMCSSTGGRGFRKWFLDNFEILNVTLHDNSQKDVFDIRLSDIFTTVSRKTSKPNNHMVEWVAYGSPPFIVDLTLYDFWPLYKDSIGMAIFNKTMRRKTGNLLVSTSENKDSPLPLYMVTANNKRQGPRQNPEPQKQFQKDTFKLTLEKSIWLGFDSATQKDLYYEWMGTKHYAYLLSMVQSTPKNQSHFFSLIGDYDFQNTDFTKYFDITPRQAQAIEEWHSLLAK